MNAEDGHKHKKQHSDYSKLEGGENARISPEELGDLVAEGDTEALEKYGGVKVWNELFVSSSSFLQFFILPLRPILHFLLVS